jgi:hypothetical protein
MCDEPMTIRKDVIALLGAEPRSVSAVARELGLNRGDAEEDLRHAIQRPDIVS